MAKIITIPKLGLTMEKATVTTWMKQEGNVVSKGEVICIIETDKVSYEVEAPEAGVLVKVMAEEGSVLPVGEVLAVIAQVGESFDLEKLIQQAKAGLEVPVVPEPAEAPSAVNRPLPMEEKRQLKVSPLARRIAEEKGISLRDIIGTGPGNSITKDDVLRAWERKGSIPTQLKIVSKKIPLKGIRKVIADRMSLSWEKSPRVTQVMGVDMSEVINFREEYRSDWEAKGTRVTINDILVRVVSSALMEHLDINSSLKDNEIEVYGNVNMGIAVATERGLVVPVLRNANQKTLLEIARESAILIGKVREGKIGPDELSFGTFTITNMGSFGLNLFTPIINPPESAILGVGKLEKRVVVADEDKIAIRSLMNLCLVFDHRVVDGAPAARFLGKIKEILEEPAQLRELN